MARLETDNIIFEISNIITFTEDNVLTYESFTFKFEYNGKKLFNNINKTKFELLDGNIQSLLDLIFSVLNEDIIKGYCEFSEPEFEFELERLGSSDITVDDLPMYQFTIWLLSGQWQMICDSSGVGCKFILYHHELTNFYNELYEEYQNRRITDYDNK